MLQKQGFFLLFYIELRYRRYEYQILIIDRKAALERLFSLQSLKILRYFQHNRIFLDRHGHVHANSPDESSAELSVLAIHSAHIESTIHQYSDLVITDQMYVPDCVHTRYKSVMQLLLYIFRLAHMIPDFVPQTYRLVQILGFNIVLEHGQRHVFDLCQRLA